MDLGCEECLCRTVMSPSELNSENVLDIEALTALNVFDDIAECLKDNVLLGKN